MLRAASVTVGLGLLGAIAQSFAGVIGIQPFSARQDTGSIEAAARAMVEVRPLDSVAYFALGREIGREGEEAKARTLVEHSITVNPRNRAARLWLLTDASLDQQPEALIENARILSGLSPQARPALEIVLAELARDPETRKLIAERLKNNPLILSTAEAAAKAGLSAEAQLELLQPTDLATLPDGVNKAQTTIVGSLLREGKATEARRTWYALAGLSPRTAVYDGSFQGRGGAAPFGWTLHNNSNVETKMVKAQEGVPSFLQVTSYGSLPEIAAEQTLTLPSGGHQLSFSYRDTEGPGRVSRFAWRMSCNPGRFIAELPVGPASERWQTSRHAFTVPPGCPLQSLKLTSTRTPQQSAKSLAVTAVTISPQ